MVVVAVVEIVIVIERRKQCVSREGRRRRRWQVISSGVQDWDWEDTNIHTRTFNSLLQFSCVDDSAELSAV